MVREDDVYASVLERRTEGFARPHADHLTMDAALGQPGRDEFGVRSTVLEQEHA
jgi:hypothetical protein